MPTINLKCNVFQVQMEISLGEVTAWVYARETPKCTISRCIHIQLTMRGMYFNALTFLAYLLDILEEGFAYSVESSMSIGIEKTSFVEATR